MKWLTDLNIPTKRKIEAVCWGLLSGAALLFELGVVEGPFAAANCGLIVACGVIMFTLSNDEEYRPHSIGFKQEEDEEFGVERTEDYYQMQGESCSIENCKTLSFRSTDYCWKHQDHIAPESEPEPEAEGNWWEEKTE